MLRSHFVLLVVYALAVSVFFTFLWKETRHERLRSFAILFASMVGASVVAAWAMYPFPF